MSFARQHRLFVVVTLRSNSSCNCFSQEASSNAARFYSLTKGNFVHAKKDSIQRTTHRSFSSSLDHQRNDGNDLFSSKGNDQDDSNEGSDDDDDDTFLIKTEYDSDDPDRLHRFRRKGSLPRLLAAPFEPQLILSVKVEHVGIAHAVVRPMANAYRKRVGVLLREEMDEEWEEDEIPMDSVVKVGEEIKVCLLHIRERDNKPFYSVRMVPPELDRSFQPLTLVVFRLPMTMVRY